MIKVWVSPQDFISLESMSVPVPDVDMVLRMRTSPFGPQEAPMVLRCCLYMHLYPSLLFLVIHLFDMQPSTQTAGLRAPEEHCPC